MYTSNLSELVIAVADLQEFFLLNTKVKAETFKVRALTFCSWASRTRFSGLNAEETGYLRESAIDLYGVVISSQAELLEMSGGEIEGEPMNYADLLEYAAHYAVDDLVDLCVRAAARLSGVEADCLQFEDLLA